MKVTMVHTHFLPFLFLCVVTYMKNVKKCDFLSTTATSKLYTNSIQCKNILTYTVTKMGVAVVSYLHFVRNATSYLSFEQIEADWEAHFDISMICMV